MPDDYNYGIAVTVTNLASAEIVKINKQLEGLGKQVERNVKTTEKGAKEEGKSLRSYGTQIKEQLTTRGYVNNLIKQDQQIFKKTNSLISKQGALSKINADIQKNGWDAITKAEKKSFKASVKAIKLRQKGGLQLTGWAKTSEEAILKVDEDFRKHSSKIRKGIGGLGAGFSKLGKIVHTVGMTFLTIIGPLFLVGAAMRMIQQVTDALVGPFLKFEDGLFEVRKTADLTKEEMLALGDAIELMAQRVPLARTELVEIAATAGRLGIEGTDNILNFTEVVAMMATATVLSADEAANALARVSNAFQLPIANVEYLGSIINELSNTTASNSREIVKSIENVGASGKMIGISIDAVAAMSATLISAGMSSERSGTRLRRFFTEMARNSSKMADAMDIDPTQMKLSIEEDPTKAIMDYLEHLREIPSRVDKVVEAQEIFGKVGGFAVATLAENYVELEMNMSNARTELAFGTSLQREFQIAVSKSSAELQILDNRIESAKSSLGEDLLPTIKSGKSILAGFYEELANISDAFENIINQGKAVETAMDALYDEVDRLNEQAGKQGYWEWLARQMGEQERYMRTEEMQNKRALGMYLAISKAKKKAKEETVPGPTPEYDIREELQALEIEQQIYKGTDALMGKHIKSLKEKGFYESEFGSTLQKVEDINIDMFKIEKGINAESKKGNEYTKESIALEVHREDARRRGLETVRTELEFMKEKGIASKEDLKDLKDITSMLDGRIVAGKYIPSMLSREAASQKLATKQQELRNRTLRDQDTFYISLKAHVGDFADEILESENLQAELNERNLEAVTIGGEFKVVTKELADGLYDMELPLESITELLEKFGDVSVDSFEDWSDRMGKLREETSNLYYAIENVPTVIKEMGKAFADSSKSAEEYEDILNDLIDDNLEFVVTSRGIEAVFKSEIKSMKKVGSEMIHVTDAMEEMNELGQDSITIWGQLTIAQSDYEDQLNSVWGLTSSYINTLRKLGDAQLLFTEASETMPTRIQEIWRPYEKAFDEIQSLIAAGDDYTAGIKIRAMADDLHAKKMSAHSKQERTDYDKIMGYVDDYVQSVGLVPLEVKEIENELGLLEDLMKAISTGEVIIVPELNDTPFSDAMKRLLDADYVTSVRVDVNLAEVKKQIEEVGAVAALKPEGWTSPETEKKIEAEKRAAVQKTQEPYGEDPGPWMEDYSFMEKYSKTGTIPPPPTEERTYTTIQPEEPTLFESINNAGQAASQAITEAGTDVYNAIVGGANYLDETFTGGKVGEGLDYVGDGLKAIGEGIKDVLPKWLGGNEMGGPISKTGLYTLHEGEHVLNKREKKDVKKMHAALGISNIIPSMETGGPIENTGLYNLHEGEHVLNKDEIRNVKNVYAPFKLSNVIPSMNRGGKITKSGIYNSQERTEVLNKRETRRIKNIYTSLGISELAPSTQLGNDIDKTGIYNLHDGERALKKRERNHIKNIYSALGISGIAPSMETEGYIDKKGMYQLHKGKRTTTKEETTNPLVSSDEVLSKMWREINGGISSRDPETVIIDAMKKGGGIDKDGLYQLHKGEAVLTKIEVDANEKDQSEASNMRLLTNPITKAVSNIKNDHSNPNTNIESERTTHIHIKNLILNENTDAKRFVSDMEIMAMSG